MMSGKRLIPMPPITPPGFTDFEGLKRQVCGFLFGRPGEDSKLLLSLREVEKSYADCLAEIETWPAYKPPVSRVVPSLANFNRTVQENPKWSDHPQKYAVKQTITELEWVRRAINTDDFRSDIAFTLNGLSQSFHFMETTSYQSWLLKQDPPRSPEIMLSLSDRAKLPKKCKDAWLLSELWSRRKTQYYQTVRQALITGRLTAHWLSPQDGEVAFPNRAVWYDDEMAQTAIETGLAKPLLDRNAVRMVFRSAELSTAFPSPKTETDTARNKQGRPAELGQSIRRALNKMAPDGYTNQDGTKAELRRKVAESLGKRDLDERTFGRHLDAHNEVVGCKY